MAIKNKKEPIIRLSRRSDLKKWQVFLIKFGTVLFALLICGAVSSIIKPGSFGKFFESVFVTTFFTSKRGETTFSLLKTINLAWATAVLFLISLAVTPAFKMKFWNIGGEGQVLMGAYGAIIVMKFIAPNMKTNSGAIILMLIFALIFSVVWAIIPAIFKSFFNTNETLFTLMLNYVAMAIVGYCTYAWRATGSTTIGVVNSDTHRGWFNEVTLWDGKSYNYVWAILIIIGVGVAVWAYMKYAKHGYEISVVGGSPNTARYVGINIKRVTIRTMAISGALAGICGWLMVSSASHSITESLVGGQGFTGVLVSWLGHFTTYQIAIYAFLVSFISKGGANAASNIGYSNFVSDVLVGIFFFFIIASEFFTSFQIHFNFKQFKKEEAKHE